MIPHADGALRMLSQRLMKIKIKKFCYSQAHNKLKVSQVISI